VRLRTRRMIRRWLLDLPYGAFGLTTALGVGVIALAVVVDSGGVFAAGLGVAIAPWYLRDMARGEACGTCRSYVDATDDRYCSTCGAWLDDLPDAPALDDRLDEADLPPELDRIERGPTALPATDGGEGDHADEQRQEPGKDRDRPEDVDGGESR